MTKQTDLDVSWRAPKGQTKTIPVLLAPTSWQEIEAFALARKHPGHLAGIRWSIIEHGTSRWSDRIPSYTLIVGSISDYTHGDEYYGSLDGKVSLFGGLIYMGNKTRPENDWEFRSNIWSPLNQNTWNAVEPDHRPIIKRLTAFRAAFKDSPLWEWDSPKKQQQRLVYP